MSIAIGVLAVILGCVCNLLGLRRSDYQGEILAVLWFILAALCLK